MALDPRNLPPGFRLDPTLWSKGAPRCRLAMLAPADDHSIYTAHGPLPRGDNAPPSMADPNPVYERISQRNASYTQRTYSHDEVLTGDGFDSSRDIVSVEASEGAPNQPYLLRMEMANLKPGAEYGHLDAYWLLSFDNNNKQNTSTALPNGIAGTTAQPWNLAVAAYDGEHSALLTPQNAQVPNAIKYAKFDPVVRVVEVALDKAALRQAGWHDGQPLKLQALTTRDYSGQIMDSSDGPQNKPWKNGNKLTDVVDTSKPATPLPARSTDWDGESVYFVFTDRFHDGDPNNNQGVNKNDLRMYHGGDLRGVIDKLDYIKNLGMTTLWISPPMQNQTRHYDPDGSYYEGFHGYWPTDFYKVDPRQGDMPTLKELVTKAHEKGMKVLIDLPMNQTAWEHPFVNDPSKQDWFHHDGNITNWDDPYQLEHGSIAWLPDLAQENPAVADYLINVGKFWVDQTGCDGFRLDAVKHIGHAFWQQFGTAMRDYAGPDFLLLGEDLHGDPNHVAAYQKEGMQSLLDYPLYYAIRDSISHGSSMRNLANRINEEDSLFDNSRVMSTFLDNHDLTRFMTDAGPDARNKLKLSLALMFTLHRIPNIYMGDEVGMDGAQEMDDPNHQPLNRKDMEFGKDPDLQAYFTKLSQLRDVTPALREGGYLEMWQDDQMLAYERCAREGSAVVVLNASEQSQHRDIPIRTSGGLREGMKLRDALSGREVEVKDGRISVDVGARSPLILLPE
jgi:alpha-amylase